MKPLLGALLLVLGGLVAYAGLVRLGWMRHGASAWDLSFLHLDWVFRRELPYWSAHMQNLVTLAIGLVASGVGVGLLGARVVHWSRARSAR